MVSFRHNAGEAPKSAPAVSKSIGFPVPRLVASAVALALAVNISAMAEVAFHKELTREQRSAFPLVIVGLRV